MKKTAFPLGLLLLLALLSAAVACSPRASAAVLTPTCPVLAVQVESYADPFAYCAAVGTLDSPDARYTGEQVPEEVINGFKKAAGLEESTMPLEIFQKTTIWRCMDGQVYACNVGANLPCSSKANTDRAPTQAMADYCQANPGSDFIPMNVTGHDIIYSFHCVKDTPELLEQIAKVDQAGFLSNIWYAIQPSP